MKTFTLENIPDEMYQTAIDALCQRGGFPSDDPTAKAEFAQNYVLTMIGNVITDYVMQSHRQQRQAEMENIRNTVDASNKAAKDIIKVKVI